MIPAIRKYLARSNVDGIPTNAQDITLVKTHNGSAHPNKKLVFIVYRPQEARPCAVVYSMRPGCDPVAVPAIAETMQGFGPEAPAVLSTGVTPEGPIAVVEWISDQRLDLNNQLERTSLLSWIQDRITAESDTQKILSLIGYYDELRIHIESLGVIIPRQFHDRLMQRLQLHDNPLAAVPQHGDLQPNNIYHGTQGMRIIDWDDYGNIDFPLFDFFTLYIRCRKIASLRDWASAAWKSVAMLYKLDTNSLHLIKALYYLYDFWRKDAVHYASERPRYFQLSLAQAEQCLDTYDAK